MVAASKTASNFAIRTSMYTIEDLDAGVDIADRLVMPVPVATGSITVQGAKVFCATNTAGVAAAPDAVTITVKDAASGNTIATRTFTSNLVKDTVYSLTLSQATDIAAGGGVFLDVTQGTNANCTAIQLQVIWNTDGLTT